MSTALGSRPPSPLDRELDSDAFIANPYPLYEVLRTTHPLYWSDSWGVWVLSRYDDISAVLRDASRFSSSGRFGALIETLPPGAAAGAEPLRRFGDAAFNVDPPVHTRLRRLLRDAFTPAAMDALRPRVQALVEELLAGVHGPSFDVVERVAMTLPVVVVSELLGASEEERRPFKSWADAVLRFLATGGARAETVAPAAQAIGDRVHEPREDLLTWLLHAPEGDRLNADELALVAVELMIAGHHTTKDLISNALICLHRNPDARRAILADRSLLPGAIEEVLRYEGSIQRGWRRVAEDVELHGQRLRQGELVFLMLGSANRDPGQFPDPERFDIRRNPNRHLAFGYGIHLCVGAPLARLEAPIAIDALLRLAPDLSLEAETIDWYPSVHVRGPQTLRLLL